MVFCMRTTTVFGLATIFLLACEVSDSRSEGGGSNISKPPTEQTDDATPDEGPADTPVQGDQNGNAPPEPIVVVSFNEVVKPLIINACGNCHQPDGAAPFLVLETYDEVKASLSAMVNSLDNNNEPMPPGASAAQRADIKKVLLDWQKAGYPKQAP